MFTNVKIKIDDIIYSSDEVCPCCGNYTADGSVCIVCQKNLGLYEPKINYIESE